MKSLSFYLTLLAIKIKGVKKEFQKDPVDYYRLREENVTTPHPKKFKPHSYTKFFIGEAEISEIAPQQDGDALIIYCHGGAFVYGPVDYHWDSVRALADKTGNKVWMVSYPKAPENDIEKISHSIDSVYTRAIETYPSKSVILAGDSVGGTLITALVQRLVLKEQKLPSLLILISPVVDATFSNPEIEKIDPKDPILSKRGALSAKKLAAAGRDLRDPFLSPLYGSFKGFPPTVLFIAENDITGADQELAAEKMREQHVDLEVYFGKGMPHIWPILPVMKEAKAAFSEIIFRIRSFQNFLKKEARLKPDFPDEVAEE